MILYQLPLWGDSMMEGFGSDDAYILTKAGRVDISYYTAPYTLGKLTGLNTFNFGVSGDISGDSEKSQYFKMHTDRNLNLNKNTYEDVCLMDDKGILFICMISADMVLNIMIILILYI